MHKGSEFASLYHGPLTAELLRQKQQQTSVDLTKLQKVINRVYDELCALPELNDGVTSIVTWLEEYKK